VWEQTVRLSCRAVLQTAFGTELADSPLIERGLLWPSGFGLDAGAHPACHTGGGGGGAGAGVSPERWRRRLGCEVAFREPHCDVANAVGAAAGVVAHSVTVQVVGDGTGNFRVHAPSGTRQFSNPSQALDTARAWAEDLARSAVLAMGAHAPEVQVTTETMPERGQRRRPAQKPWCKPKRLGGPPLRPERWRCHRVPVRAVDARGQQPGSATGVHQGLGRAAVIKQGRRGVHLQHRLRATAHDHVVRLLAGARGVDVASDLRE